MKKITHAKTVPILLAALSAFAVLGMTACGQSSGVSGQGGSDSGNYVGSYSYSAPSENGVSAEKAAETMEMTSAASGTWSAGTEMTEEVVKDSDVFSSGSTGSAGQESLSNTGRKLIRTINLNVETTEFDTLLENLRQAVEADGGYIEYSDMSGSSISESGGRRNASLTARIPSDKLDAFLSKVSEQSNVVFRSESVEDVTLQYTDIESRKKSLTIEQDRLWELLEKADSLESVIALEQRLSEIRYELEKFESQLRIYDNQVDYGTVMIDISEVATFTPTTPDSVFTRVQKGFTRNLRNVGNSLVDFFVWFLSSLPTLAVWAVILAAAVLIIRAVSRKARRGKSERASRTSGTPKKAKTGKSAGQTANSLPPLPTARTPEAADGQTGQTTAETAVPDGSGNR